MIDFEAIPSSPVEGFDNLEAVRTLASRVYSREIDLGFSRYAEDILRERWYDEGYMLLMTFVGDDDSNPMVVSRLNQYRDANASALKAGDMRYRFFIDGETKDVTIPVALSGGVVQPFFKEEDYLFYDLGNEADFRDVIENCEQEMADSLAWLYERLGRTLKMYTEGAVPYIANESEVLGVRLDAFTK